MRKQSQSSSPSQPTMSQAIEATIRYREEVMNAADNLEFAHAELLDMASKARSMAARMQASAGVALKAAKTLRGMI